MTPAAGRPLAVLCLAAAWLSAGSEPFVGALAGAREPIDFARDYLAAHVRVHRGRGAAPIDASGNAYAAAIGVPPVVMLAAPYYVHPPAAQLLVLPLVPLGFRGAALVWLALSLVALGGLALMLVAVVTGEQRPRPLQVAVAFGLLVLWPPVLHNLAKGQWSIFLATLVAAGWRALDRGRPRTAGAWLGLAASLKATPLLLLGYLILRHRRAAGAMAAMVLAAGLASLAVSGVEPWRVWLAAAAPNVLAWQTWLVNTASVNGLFARLFTSSAFARPLLDAPLLARVLTVTVAAALLAVASLSSWRAARSPTEDRRLFATWTTLVVVLNPLGWTHTAIIALVPLALLVDRAPPWALVTTLVALTVPHETL
ncbi:MAG TPA: glycosyltransferase family 87 protein, partial [Polyangia bacterium]|nr:glycosyltransferase family 87 protein [Polyangia bacterium]